MNKIKRYYKEVRDELIHRMDVHIDRQLSMADMLYTPEVLRNIRDKQYKELNSNNLGSFVRKELS